ncbi:MAG: non-homologous end-joining DNA ligase [Bryobacteraceae bacterium]
MPKRTKRTADSSDIEGRDVPVSNLQKVLYPGRRFTKVQVIDYYIRVSRWLLPHLHDRPVTLKRFPDGVRGDAFYEKDVPSFAPDWIRTFPVPRHAGGPDIKYILINDLPTLVWCANAATLELHPFLHRVPELALPTSVVFDLDPGEGSDVLTFAKVGLLLKDLLEQLQLISYPKVSGSKGIQVYVPLNAPVTYAVTQPFARSLAELLASQHPRLIVAEMPKEKRKGKVFIDWSQNSDFKTTVGVYSLRGKNMLSFVSLPVTWEELKVALDKKDGQSLYWEPEPALERVTDKGDLFAQVLVQRQSLPAAVLEALGQSVNPAPKPNNSLREYERKRDFRKTAEPGPRVPRASSQGSKKRFVIQKHAASHLHYDFRLEMHNVLKSWAIPKGIPYALEERRLAMATEDHPVEYLEFEGIIPEGQYGGGTVMVWDIGSYEIVEGNYYKGSLHVFLKGKKLKGDWLLSKDRTGSAKWKIEKIDSAAKPVSTNKENASALTGRTMEQIAAEAKSVWHSNRTSVADLDLDSLPDSQMRFVEPMQCKLVAKLPEGSEWQYEVKLDGYRALAIRSGSHVSLLSRRNRSLADQFPEIETALASLEDGIILDGEIVTLDSNGRPSFNLLQNYTSKAANVVYYVFDQLAYRRKDLSHLALSKRREVLDALLEDVSDPIRRSAILNASAEQVIAAVKDKGLEGLVAKRSGSRYEPGQRTGQWVKYKTNRGQEFVVGGYRVGRNEFDNLAIGYYEGNKLLFIAKLKNGFTPTAKKAIYERLRKLETTKCPFDNLPESKNARRGEALTEEATKNYRWTKPALVVQVDFTDWTAANHLRHSSFVGLRDDKKARDVHKEEPEA